MTWIRQVAERLRNYRPTRRQPEPQRQSGTFSVTDRILRRRRERGARHKGKPYVVAGTDDLDGVLGPGDSPPSRMADLTPEKRAELEAEFAKPERQEHPIVAEWEGRDAPDEGDDQGGIKPSMSEAELRAAGVRIDVPSEGASSNPRRLRYADGEGLNFPGARDFEAEAKAKAEKDEDDGAKPEPPRLTPEL